MKSVLSYPGGKYNMQLKLHPLIDSIPYAIFVEVFGGSGIVTLAKRPGPVDVYNDLDKDVHNFFWVLRHQPEELQRALTLTPYSRGEFEQVQSGYTKSDPVEWARAWFTLSQQSFNNLGGHWAASGANGHRRGMSKRVADWLTRIDDRLPQVVDRLRRIQLENLDFEACIKRYDSPATLFYLDPPYLPSTRVRKKTYTHEMDLSEHERLVKTLLKIEGRGILSGYDNALYAELGWQKVLLGEYVVSMGYSPNKTTLSKRNEWVWVK